MKQSILFMCLLVSVVVSGCGREVTPPPVTTTAVPDERTEDSASIPVPASFPTSAFPTSRNTATASDSAAPVGASTTGTPSIESRSAWDGVYTSQQRDRGEELYLSACVRCHGEDLVGNDAVPTLVGDAFLRRWKRKRAGNLFSYMKQEMPPKETLDSLEYADLLAFLFCENGMPAGKQELPDNFTALQAIRLGTAGQHSF